MRENTIHAIVAFVLLFIILIATEIMVNMPKKGTVCNLSNNKCYETESARVVKNGIIF